MADEIDSLSLGPRLFCHEGESIVPLLNSSPSPRLVAQGADISYVAENTHSTSHKNQLRGRGRADKQKGSTRTTVFEKSLVGAELTVVGVKDDALSQGDVVKRTRRLESVGAELVQLAAFLGHVLQQSIQVLLQ